MRTVHLSIEAYYSDGSLAEPEYSSEWSGKKYYFTKWYRMLQWQYTPIPIAYYLIKDDAGNVLEKVQHHHPLED